MRVLLSREFWRGFAAYWNPNAVASRFLKSRFYSERVDDAFGGYTLIVADRKLAMLYLADLHPTFQVVKDEWNADCSQRIIWKANVLEVAP